MHSQNRRSLHQGNCVEGSSAVERSGRVAAYEFEYHALARDAHEHGQFEFEQLFGMAHNLIVLLKSLAEAIAGVEDDVLRSSR